MASMLFIEHVRELHILYIREEKNHTKKGDLAEQVS
jgi:hypothetical protein